MKTCSRFVLILLTVGMMAYCADFCTAGDESGQEDRRSDRGGRRGRWEPSEEEVKHAMEQLERSDRRKMEELQRLWRKDRERFMEEIRTVIINQRSERIDEENSDFLKWLKENYPQEAQNLAEYKKERPDRYGRMIWYMLRRYGNIFETARENPELAEILKKDLELRDRRDNLIRRIRNADDEDERKPLIGYLRDVLRNMYDLIVQRKQLEYKQLLIKLEQLKEEIAKSSENVKNWQDPETKDERVDTYLEELIKNPRRSRFPWDD